MDDLKRFSKSYQNGVQHPIESMKELGHKIMYDYPDIEAVGLMHGIATDFVVIGFAVLGVVYARKLNKK